MPQSSERLRKKFMLDGSDGIHEAITAIEADGGTIEKGIISYNGQDDDAWDACQFLTEEWDYALNLDHPEPVQISEPAAKNQG